ncbi:MAG: hypothetical protein KDD43_04055 [Bdellovibrionales bacterium]|nr:hypothetical protein [Bdellovibrionales bacterium]
MRTQGLIKIKAGVLLTALAFFLFGCGSGYEVRSSDKNQMILGSQHNQVETLNQDLRSEIDDLNQRRDDLNLEVDEELIELVNELLDEVDQVLEKMGKAVDWAKDHLPSSLRKRLSDELVQLEEKVLDLFAKVQSELDLNKNSHQELNQRLNAVKQQVRDELAQMRQELS